MTERLPAAGPPELSAHEQAQLRADVGAETQAARFDLASECQDEFNQSPEGRLQLVCAEEGLSLAEADPSVLLENRHLQVAFSRPLPMPPRIRTRCVGILCEVLGSEEIPEEMPTSAAVTARQADLDDSLTSEAGAESQVNNLVAGVESEQAIAQQLDAEGAELAAGVETATARAEAEIGRNAQRADRNAEQAETIESQGVTIDEQGETIDAQAAAVENLIRTQVSTGNLEHYETETTRLLEAEYEGEELANALAAAESFFAPHRQNLTAMQAIFTPQEVQQVFGGALTGTVTLNLSEQSNADIYRDLFARIDAGFAGDDDRRRAVRSQVEAQLGLSLRPPAQPRNASELQDSLREGRGTERVQVGTETVEEPPNSGIWIEQPIYEEQVIPYNEADALVLSTNPLITVFPDPPGGTQHRVEGVVEGGDPVRIMVDVPPEGAFPAAVVNNRMNEQMMNTVFRSGGMTGVLEHLHGRGDSSLGAAAETDFDSLGQNDMTQSILQAFIGENATLGGRFITGSEMHDLEGGLRHLTPGGDFGAFNQMEPAAVNQLMTALLGDNRADISTNLNLARPHINTGVAETPSYEALYQAMYPDDAANGYPRLRGIIGDSGMGRLDLDLDAPQAGTQTDAL